MNLLEAILLGIVQGATEFLPVSSSGHLLLVPSLLRLPEPDLNVISVAHVGTLLALLLYFWGDVWVIVRAVAGGLWRRQPLHTAEARLGWAIVVGSIPAALLGLPLQSRADTVFGHPTVAALFLLLTSALLLAGERLYSGQKRLEGMGWWDAIAIGLMQMLALLPGISRSGSTITAGMARGLDRATAARFSFLLGMPAAAGAGLLAAADLSQAANLPAQLPALLITLVMALLVGYVCIHFLLTWLRQRSLYLFAGYTAAFSLFYLAVTWLR